MASHEGALWHGFSILRMIFFFLFFFSNPPTLIFLFSLSLSLSLTFWLHDAGKHPGNVKHTVIQEWHQLKTRLMVDEKQNCSMKGSCLFPPLYPFECNLFCRQPLFVQKNTVHYPPCSVHLTLVPLFLPPPSLLPFSLTLYARCINYRHYSPVLWLCCMRYQHSKVILIAR